MRLLTVIILCLPGITLAAAQGWPQWGGPQRNFTVTASGLANAWPADGPRKIWSRTLGAGHSSIVVDGNRLYTMYSKGDQEFVVALDRASGKTIWENAYPSDTSGLVLQVESIDLRGPHSTPLIAGNLLITAGTGGRLQAFDKSSGKNVWSHDLWREYKGTRLERGYTCSPLAYKNLIIVSVGGPGQSVMAFEQATGAVVWKKQTFRLSPSSPILINVDGRDQIVMTSADHVHGIDPPSGDLLWQHAHPCGGFNISTPVWGRDNILLVSAAYDCGTRALQLRHAGGKTTVRELWFTNRMRVHHGTVLRIGDLILGSSGNAGIAPVTAVDVTTGKVVWQDRTFPKANFVYADGKLIVLDENGRLALVQLSTQGMKVVSSAPVLEPIAWTPPTLVDSNLYLRDRRTIVALDLK
jgi:outer membrane protein assembly factor BamB